MESVCGRMKYNVSCPDGLQLLDYQGVREESLRLRPYGDLYAGYAGPGSRDTIRGCGVSCAWRGEALERVKVVEQRVNQLQNKLDYATSAWSITAYFTRSGLFEYTHGQQLAQHPPCTANADGASIHLCILLKL
jgi:hypothetical protein